MNEIIFSFLYRFVLSFFFLFCFRCPFSPSSLRHFVEHPPPPPFRDFRFKYLFSPFFFLFLLLFHNVGDIDFLRSHEVRLTRRYKFSLSWSLSHGKIPWERFNWPEKSLRSFSLFLLLLFLLLLFLFYFSKNIVGCLYYPSWRTYRGSFNLSCRRSSGSSTPRIG